MDEYIRGSYVTFVSDKTEGVAKILDETTAQYIEVKSIDGIDVDGCAVELSELNITGRADSIKYGRMDEVLQHRWDKMPLFHETMAERDIERMNDKCSKMFIKGVLNHSISVKWFADKVYQVNTQFGVQYINDETLNVLTDFSVDFLRCYLSHNNPDDRLHFKLHNLKTANKFVEREYGICITE